MPSGWRAPLKTAIWAGGRRLVMCAASLSARTLFFTWLVCRRRHIPCGKLAGDAPGRQPPKLVFRCRARSFVASQRRDEREGELLYGIWERMKNEENRGQFYHPTRKFFGKKTNKKLTRV
jgi:hypothetical protein